MRWRPTVGSSRLPPQPDGALNAPVVQVQQSGRTIDLRGDYLKGCGEADILFPTNFDHLARLVGAASERAAGGGARGGGGGGGGGGLATAHMTSAAFMRRWHDVGATRTRSGFNPLVDDFTNTKFLVTGADGVDSQ